MNYIFFLQPTYTLTSEIPPDEWSPTSIDNEYMDLWTINELTLLLIFPKASTTSALPLRFLYGF